MSLDHLDNLYDDSELPQSEQPPPTGNYTVALASFTFDKTTPPADSDRDPLDLAVFKFQILVGDHKGETFSNRIPILETTVPYLKKNLLLAGIVTQKMIDDNPALKDDDVIVISKFSDLDQLEFRALLRGVILEIKLTNKPSTRSSAPEGSRDLRVYFNKRLDKDAFDTSDLAPGDGLPF
jgi:hypothetical protein